jgi:two-component system CheB/CheR fusion protein
MQKGVGLNSIPNRFALLCGVVTSLIVFMAYIYTPIVEGFSLTTVNFMVSLVLIPTTITYLAAKKLSQQILQLKKSADTIAQGNFDHPIDVECMCDVGNLADSFRGLVHRINSNIVRMNILAYSDALTKLPNRAVVQHMLTESSKDEHRNKCTVLFMDINGFKRINDTFGHHVGDEFLKQAADRIVIEGFNRSHEQLDMCMSNFGELCDRPPTDIVVARYAGDEFVAILPGSYDELALRKIANQISNAFKKPFYCESNQITSSISIGAANFPEHTSNPLELLKYSDLAMYAAKRDEIRDFVLFQKPMHEKIKYRNWIEQALITAISNDQIFLQFQPKVNVISGQLSGVEALARWKHPEHGLISPEVFISVAEETGLIIPLGRKVMELALEQSKRWADQGLDRKIAINIAPSQFGSQEFLPDTLKLLEENDVPAKSIELEITESMAMSKFGETKKQLEMLREAGISIGLDDFGTGFSNLSQLSSLPFDTLKIDRSLIADIGVSEKNETILVAVIRMASALGYETVAEGIEIEQQYRFLEVVGCDVIQGYFAGKPMLPDDLDVWEQNYSHPSQCKANRNLHYAA